VLLDQVLHAGLGGWFAEGEERDEVREGDSGAVHPPVDPQDEIRITGDRWVEAEVLKVNFVLVEDVKAVLRLPGRDNVLQEELPTERELHVKVLPWEHATHRRVLGAVGCNLLWQEPAQSQLRNK